MSDLSYIVRIMRSASIRTIRQNWRNEVEVRNNLEENNIIM